MAALAGAASLSPLQAFIDRVNTGYEVVHRNFEEQFWGNNVALGQGFSTAQLTQTREEMETFLRDPGTLAEAETWLASGEATEAQTRCLEIFVRTFRTYQMADQATVALRKQCATIEDKLNAGCNTEHVLGYTDPTDGAFKECSKRQLLTMLKTQTDEATRRAAWEGLRSIGLYILSNGFCEIVKLRNELARKLGYTDFYDMKVTQAEGFGKDCLFEILDGLKAGSDTLLAEAQRLLTAEKGPTVLDPWNYGHMKVGNVETKLDPYFPFETALEQWGRTYSKLGITYRGATINMDLLERQPMVFPHL